MLEKKIEERTDNMRKRITILFSMCFLLCGLTGCEDIENQTPDEYINNTIDPALNDIGG